jgi:hypothetical protein
MTDIIYRIDERDNISIMLVAEACDIRIEDHAAILHTTQQEGFNIIRIGTPVEITNGRWLGYREFMESGLCPGVLKYLLPIIIAEERYKV